MVYANYSSEEMSMTRTEVINHYMVMILLIEFVFLVQITNRAHCGILFNTN